MVMDEKLREKLAQPFGPVLEASQAIHRLFKDRPTLLIAVGDQTIYNLLSANHVPDIGIFDLRCQRKAVEEGMQEYILTAATLQGGAPKIHNPAGGITPAMEKAVTEAVRKGKGWLQIEGEDDLAALVAMAHAPDHAVVLYGQPKEGMVWAGISQKLRHEAQELLQKVKEGKK